MIPRRMKRKRGLYISFRGRYSAYMLHRSGIESRRKRFGTRIDHRQRSFNVINPDLWDREPTCMEDGADQSSGHDDVHRSRNVTR